MSLATYACIHVYILAYSELKRGREEGFVCTPHLTLVIPDIKPVGHYVHVCTVHVHIHVHPHSDSKLASAPTNGSVVLWDINKKSKSKLGELDCGMLKDTHVTCICVRVHVH